jgi:P27 family predicted phage terminase small subunit
MNKSTAGRKKLPTALKMLKGTDQPCRLNKSEPKPEATKIRAPTGLSPQAKKHWRSISKELIAAGIIVNTDTNSFTVLCETYAQWIDTTAQLNVEGVVIQNEKGFPMLNPAFNASHKLALLLRTLFVEFGMTPSSRTNIVSTKADDKPESPWQAFGT